MDIKKIINDKTKEVLESGDVQKLIEDNIVNSINRAIKDQFGGYQFERVIEEKLSEMIDPVLKELSFDNYNEIIIGRMKEVIKGYMDGNLVDKVEAAYKDLFVSDPTPLKLSDFFDIVREEFKGEDGENYDEYFSVDIETKEDGNFTWWTIKIDENEKIKGRYDTWDYEIKFLEYDGTGSTEGDSLSSIRTPNLEYSKDTQGVLLKASRMSGLERLLLNAYFSERVFILDVDDEGDIDKSKFDEY